MIGKGFFQKPEIKGAFILSCGTIVSLAMLCISFLVHKNSNLLVKYSQILLEKSPFSLLRNLVPSFSSDSKYVGPVFRYPVILNRFHLNVGTGGKGLHNGGDGVVRELLFRRPLTLSVLCERRVYSPYGLKGKGRLSVLVFYGFVLCCEGGSDGAKGRNTLISSDGKEKSLPGKTIVHVRGSVSTCVSVLQHEHV